MAYTPYEWTVNSYLNPTRMNAIEQGIAEASQAAESASGEFHTIEELIGTQSIAGIGDGTLTGATWKINNDLSNLKNTVTTLNSKITQKIKYVDVNCDLTIESKGLARVEIQYPESSNSYKPFACSYIGEFGSWCVLSLGYETNSTWRAIIHNLYTGSLRFLGKVRFFFYDEQ